MTEQNYDYREETLAARDGLRGPFVMVRENGAYRFIERGLCGDVEIVPARPKRLKDEVALLIWEAFKIGHDEGHKQGMLAADSEAESLRYEIADLANEVAPLLARLAVLGVDPDAAECAEASWVELVNPRWAAYEVQIDGQAAPESPRMYRHRPKAYSGEPLAEWRWGLPELTE
ncbi:hypothetical protein DSS3P1_20 [Ruegeria phage DSS3-P1]|uniref:hypothetical protein n=1 Tax=Ruegeria phage DSS3-P1 TaxID=1555208 RepID=UPI0002357D52|nr:hypothetical protein DSS3P1_20 [Ruegeria phage DSS3-P1]YP_009997237.1 hypothetical protein JT312_gp20 [Ruegeria phage vB_RpoS-V18]YP_009997319.1 hypothetical protein JT313_gp20 [Ruegeria phage vB_RpoS-V11]YP_009997402.1 hypothetical protein JT314_gp21 [Ruegeria phage vB_RpoS-V7]AET42316.1 hypothetical protein SDSG_00051 [Ruegeria phage DSS3-P1]AIT13255.1 hypothetical protein DSS3P1_20 [Ruegeria phage DSS3-P1]AWY08724.1 hypothetical protein vBRpoSV7_21 [Ruegeria phage vB_RpoS-V7]AWY08896.1